MFCAVEGCSNRKSKSRYFLFPKDAKLRQRWVEFCRRTDKINTKLEKICVQHFLDSDFERDLPYELGVYNKPRPLKLKPESVPSVSNNEEDFDFEYEGELEGGDDKQAKSLAQRKRIVDSLLTEYEEKQSNESLEQDEEITDEQPTEEVVQVVVDADAYLTALERENILLRRENFKMSLANKKVAAEKEKLRQQLEAVNARYNNLYTQLEKVFSRSQIHKLQSGKRIMWPKQDLKDAFTLYAASPTVYSMLLQKNYPLPSTRALQQMNNNENISKVTQDSFEFEEGSELIEIIDITQLDHNYIN
ncbi:52 kDa repressor of the inhibitor of the protein kinase-like [Drosophila sulfurigaster albostrigata]|uniref:52 kDa repressor of the inhibitor of the protein kinase-like n=1 Tax=Drosophila sulfurigaster albostrigata TaxID=89887 RepID=UPI002D218B07|nr:52 kDa repressor of the inhibitor of the protein kinase-like [Drosophila sulfurigaster albostrigata]